MSNSRKGLTKTVTDYRTGGEAGRPAPSPQRQNPYFYVGIVMDDSDNQRMGRLWVYIPKQSMKRFGDHSTPDYGGTTPDRETGRLDIDAKLRAGWIQCYPLLPYAGTDFNRVRSSPDGRNARETGNSNSYGFWFQPRIGDHVGILYDHADPGHGFWIGCLPRPFSNFSMPGVSGVQKSTLSETLNTQFFSKTTPANSIVPSMDKINEEGSGKRFTGTFAPTEFTNNLLEAGLISDPLRGASVSSARRESPSYVVGLKSPGWDFDSEKNNFNVESGLKFDGTPVGQSPSTSTNSKYKNISTVGHQFVMDDHPEYQGVRIRTSAGSQLYFNDRSAAEPFIYISTAKGNVWLEFRDDGKIDVYAKDDISFHAEGDINFVADGNMAFEVGGTLRTKVGTNYELQVTGTSAMEMGQKFSIAANAGLDINVIGSFLQNSTEETSFGAAGGSIYIEGGGAVNVKGTFVKLDGSIGVDLIGNTVNAQASSSISLNGGGEVRAQAGIIWLNSGGGLPVLPAVEGPSPTMVPITPGGMLSGPPNPDQIISGATPDPVQSIASRLPQHQPWDERSANTRGFNGFVEEAADDPLAPVPFGAARTDATRPVHQKGYINGSTEPKVYKGKDYQTNSYVELPEFEEIRDPEPGELADVNELNASERLIKYLHTKEGLVTRTAYLDAGVAWAIGYGHNIKIGDRINGTLAFNGRTETREFRVDSDFISVLNRSAGTALSITEAEADRIFRVDLEKFEGAVRRNVEVDLSQGQFDALVSITYNIGEGNMKKSTFLRKINSRNFQDVPAAWVLWRKSRVNGVLQVNEGLQKRRQEEIELFWAATESDVTVA